MYYETSPKRINTTPENIYNFLIDTSNFESLLPKRTFSNFSSDGNKCSFQLRAIKFTIQITEAIPNNKIVFETVGNNIIQFKFTFIISPEGSETYLTTQFDTTSEDKWGVIKERLKGITKYITHCVFVKFFK